MNLYAFYVFNKYYRDVVLQLTFVFGKIIHYKISIFSKNINNIKIFVCMNVTPRIKNNYVKGDVYLILKKNKLPQYEKLKKDILNSNIKKNILLNNDLIQPTIKLSVLQKNKNKFSNSSCQNTNTKMIINRKYSDISIEEYIDRSDHFGDQQCILVAQGYNNSIIESDKKQNDNDKQFDAYQETKKQNQFQIFNKQQAKCKNFKKFFTYLLQFKLIKNQSYHPSKYDISKQIISNSTKNKIRKANNNLHLKVYFVQDKNQSSKLVLKKNHQKQQIKKSRKQIENSQVSLVDVRISNFSAENQHVNQKLIIKHGSSNNKLEVSHKHKVYFDIENPDQSSHNYQINPIVHSVYLSQNLYRSQNRIVSFEQLKQKLTKAKENLQQNACHLGFFCDQCKMQPIVGKRYKCILCCEDYDLCQKCYQTQILQFKTIMNRYDNCVGQLNEIRTSNYKKYHRKPPLLNQQMSDILQQDFISPNLSQQTQRFASSYQIMQTGHIHVMQQVKLILNRNLINLTKILKQTNNLRQSQIQKLNHLGSQKQIGSIKLTQINRNYLSKTKSPRDLFYSQRTVKIDQVEEISNQVKIISKQAKQSFDNIKDFQNLKIQDNHSKYVKNKMKQSQTGKNRFGTKSQRNLQKLTKTPQKFKNKFSLEITQSQEQID